MISVKSITKSFRLKKGVKKVLNTISFQLFQEEIVALLGVNGAGKTTLSTLLAGIHPPSSGDILYQNQSIYSNLPAFRKLVGFCPQKQNLDMDLTLEQNLFFAGYYYHVPHRELRKRVDLLIDRFQLSEYTKNKASILSGGYRQRFLIARALIHNPKLLILDEPTAGLDPHIRRELWSYIRQLKNQGVGILLTTHYLDEAEQLADRVFLLNKGKIETTGTPKHLITLHQKKSLEDVFIELIER